MPESKTDDKVVIKKYANRRLYDTRSSAYVTLDDLRQMVQDGVDFVVYDAKTKEDLTRAVLTQIIVEEEGKGQSLLPENFLRQIITCYGDNMRWMLPQYLDSTMSWFQQNQEAMRKQVETSFGRANPLTAIEEVSRHNMAAIEQAMRIFNPFVPPTSRPGGSPDDAPASTEPAPTPETRDSIDQLRRDLATLQKQMNDLYGRKE
ncbi:polyhydroxyalkanoate synthesis repressor PhaR [Constrictibacter sp. MBR-5]|jgi:polyhydroxyalkanoate synthesis repressor PhaR|uniref:polyhydroxyalkanoate synthesis repressor PhaR n=1 Tax=Constrictibacter sp. MBR-5 TaxID=3156467 RepID=UPI00339081BA